MTSISLFTSFLHLALHGCTFGLPKLSLIAFPTMNNQLLDKKSLPCMLSLYSFLASLIHTRKSTTKNENGIIAVQERHPLRNAPRPFK
jgi:hypothetical protein